MLPQITVAKLSPCKMASCLIELDIYLNKVLRSVFDEGLISKHSAHSDSNVQQRSYPDLTGFADRRLELLPLFYHKWYICT